MCVVTCVVGPSTICTCGGIGGVIPACDRQTDGQTDGQTRVHACGKKLSFMCMVTCIVEPSTFCTSKGLGTLGAVIPACDRQTDRQTDRRRDTSACLWKEVVVHVYGYVRRLYRRTVDRLYLGLRPVPRVLLPIRVADHPVLPHHDLRKFPARPQPLPPPPPSSSSSSPSSLSSFSFIRHNQLTWATIYTNKETDRQTDKQQDAQQRKT